MDHTWVDVEHRVTRTSVCVNVGRELPPLTWRGRQWVIGWQRLCLYIILMNGSCRVCAEGAGVSICQDNKVRRFLSRLSAAMLELCRGLRNLTVCRENVLQSRYWMHVGLSWFGSTTYIMVLLFLVSHVLRTDLFRTWIYYFDGRTHDPGWISRVLPLVSGFAQTSTQHRPPVHPHPHEGVNKLCKVM